MVDGQLDCLFVIDDDVLRSELEDEYGKKFISSRHWSGIKAIFLSRCWVTSTGMPIRIPWASRRREVINLWHGVPLKRVGILEYDIPFVNKLILKYLYRNQYTCITATSRAVAKIMSDSFLCPRERVKIFGLPQNDLLQNPTALSSLSGIPKSKKLDAKFKILYCPTFRGDRPTRLFPFDDFSDKLLEEHLEETNSLLVIRRHPLDKSKGDNLASLKRCISLDLQTVPDIAKVLGQFDLLITDYSSIYIDFLLLSRPLLFLPYDLEEYIKSRGLNFDYHKVTPGPKPNTFLSFLTEASTLLENTVYFSKEREEARAYFHEFEGSSCSAIESHINERLA